MVQSDAGAVARTPARAALVRLSEGAHGTRLARLFSGGIMPVVGGKDGMRAEDRETAHGTRLRRAPVRRALRLWSAAGLLAAFLVGPAAVACPICSGTAPNLTLLQRLINADRALVAQPAGGGDFRILASVKAPPGTPDRPGTTLRKPVFAPGEDVPTRIGAPPVLLLRQSLGGAWIVAGPMPATAAPDARRLVGAQRSADMTPADWQARVRRIAPLLEHPVALLAETAYGEIARSPYSAMRSVRGLVPPADLKVWIADPARAPRRALYWLLYGIVAGPSEARDIASRVDALGRVHGLTDLSSLLAADLEAGGAARRAVLRKRYFEDRARTLPELQEAVLAFTVHADAGDAALQRETAAMFGGMVRTHRALGGLVAADLARWRYWEAVPDYVALLRSRALHPVMRQPVLDYLTASGRPEALAAVAAAATEAARPTGSAAVIPTAALLSGRIP